MVRIKCHDAVDGLGAGVDVKGLAAPGLVVGDKDDTPLFDVGIMAAVDGVCKLTLVYAVALLRDQAHATIRQAANAIACKVRFSGAIQNRDHTVYHLGYTLIDVIPVPL